jgi:signal transduction histidine kinase
MDGRGKVTRLIASAIDITERIKSMNELATARHLADDANRAKSEFLANISHEIRSPLSAILGYAEILESELTDSGERQYVTTIYDSGQHLLGLVNDILDLSRIEAGRLPVHKEAFAIPVLLEGLHAAFVPAADEKGIELNIRGVTPLPTTVIGDVKRTRQILVNLLSNAVKFTEAGFVGIDVAFFAGADGPRLDFCVHDTGPGIAESKQVNLFQAFSQIDATDARVHGGAGLGLAISRQLALLLDGSVSLESRPGAGSRFTLTLPVALVPDAGLTPDGTAFATKPENEKH